MPRVRQASRDLGLLGLCFGLAAAVGRMNGVASQLEPRKGERNDGTCDRGAGIRHSIFAFGLPGFPSVGMDSSMSSMVTFLFAFLVGVGNFSSHSSGGKFSVSSPRSDAMFSQ